MKRTTGVSLLLAMLLYTGCEMPKVNTDVEHNQSASKTNIKSPSLSEDSSTGLSSEDADELSQILADLLDVDGLVSDDSEDTKASTADDLNMTVIEAEDRKKAQESQQQEVVNPETLDYTLRGGCGYFSDLFGKKNWFYTFGSSADKIDARIVDDRGDEILKLKNESYFGGNTYIATIAKHDHKNANLLKSHFDNNVLIECVYKDEKTNEAQVFHDFAPLSDVELWKKRLTSGYPPVLTFNDTLMYGSFLTDLRYKIYLKNYKHFSDKKLALQKTDDFMEKAFPKGVYRPTRYMKHKNMWNGHNIAPKKSKEATYYRKMNNLAWEYTDKRVDLLNDLIAENYESYYINHTGCTDKWICSSVFPDATEPLISDPEFHEGLLQWDRTDELHGSTLGSIKESLVSTTPRKYDIKLSLKANHGTNTPISYLDVHQTYPINSVDELDEINFKIKSKKLYGGTANPWNLTNSGLAGYFACFNDSGGKELGCMIVSDYTDKITLPILIGYMFKVESTSSLYIVQGDRSPFEANYNLGKIVKEELPAVRNRLSEVASVSVGAFVTEATQEKRCTECVANVDAEGIYLVKIK